MCVQCKEVKVELREILDSLVRVPVSEVTNGLGPDHTAICIFQLNFYSNVLIRTTKFLEMPIAPICSTYETLKLNEIRSLQLTDGNFTCNKVTSYFLEYFASIQFSVSLLKHHNS